MGNAVEKGFLKLLKMNAEILMMDSKIMHELSIASTENDTQVDNDSLWQKFLIDSFNLHTIMLGYLDAKIEQMWSIPAEEENLFIARRRRELGELRDTITSNMTREPNLPIFIKVIIRKIPIATYLYSTKKDEQLDAIHSSLYSKFLEAYKLGYDTESYLNCDKVLRTYTKATDNLIIKKKINR